MILIVIIAGLIGGYLYFTNTTPKENDNKDNYEADKTSTNTGNKATPEENTTSKNITEIKVPETQEPQYQEEVISTFSTKIYTKDSARQNNVNISCNTLNNTIVKNGETFSFCNTVGRASKEKGYQEADIFDNKGNKKKGLGGRKLSVE